MRKPIYNFYHELPVGKYPINGGFLEIESEHIDNIQKKSKDLETAALEFDKEKPSILFFEKAAKTCFDDVCLYLSLLTGCQVVLDPKEIIQFKPHECSVDIKFLHESFPESFDNLKEIGLVSAFWCDVNYTFYSALEIQAYYASSCINKIYDNCSSKDKQKFPKEFIDRLKAFIDKKINDFPIVAEEKKYLDDAKNRIEIKKELSAVYKTEYFCQNYIIKRELKNDEKDRLKLLNKVRNSFVHKAADLIDKVPGYSGMSKERIMEVSVACVNITKYMCDYHLLVNVLGLDEILLSSTKRSITRFIETGEFNGAMIFDESFEEFFERRKKEFDMEH